VGYAGALPTPLDLSVMRKECEFCLTAKSHQSSRYCTLPIGPTQARVEIFQGGGIASDSAASILNVENAKTSLCPGPCLLLVDPRSPDRRSPPVSSHRSGNGSRQGHS
jgi:hypothetical protein